LRAPGPKRAPRAAPATLFARLITQVALETRRDGTIAACFEGYSVDIGTFSAETAKRAQSLRSGLALSSIASDEQHIDQELQTLVRRLAGHGLLEYPLRRARAGVDQVVVEPQGPDYWPQTPQLDGDAVVVLSRFAYLRRRGNDLVLESPRANALFRLCDPKVAQAIALLSAPQQIKQLRQHDGFAGLELLALLLDCEILFAVEPAGNSGLRPDEGDASLVLWDFHDLLFHTRSTQGRHANPLGGLYPYAGMIDPPPAVRPRWPGSTIDLRKLAPAPPEAASPTSALLRQRHSTREFDARHPITLAELARFLDGTARVLSEASEELGDGGPVVGYAIRPFPSGGGSYELELYLAVDACDGLARGFYHYDAGGHLLVPIADGPRELDAMLAGAGFAMGVETRPQIVITIAARFGRTTWKYSSIAYALILKDVGVLLQTFYLMATDMGLGGCAIGTVDIDLFAKMTGLAFHVEGPVGQFAIGRSLQPPASS
jgi:SagB-type dehydrogenase family enzyme